MLKRNKLTIFLVLVVVGLTIYYVSTPTKKASPVGNEDIVETRYQLYADARLKVLTERNTEISGYEEILTQVSVVSEDVRLNAVSEIARIKALTEREVALEEAIIDLGYKDCLVYKEEENVYINVLTQAFSVDKYIEVALLVKAEFGNENTISITVNPK